MTPSGCEGQHLEVNECIEYNECPSGVFPLATLTIRDLDESLKRRLRMRAASRNRSMEEEARQILRGALLEGPAAPVDLAARIRARFTGLGDVNLPLAEREPMRTPPTFEADARAAPAIARRSRARTTRSA